MKHVTRLLLALAPLTCACAETSTYETQILLSLVTDLEPGAELDHVTAEALTASADDTFGQPIVLSVSDGCAGEGGTFQLGTLGIASGRRSSVRLRVRGYVRDSDMDRVVVERRVDARFQEGRALGLEVFLGRRCADRSCAAEETCEPATGSCEEIPVFDDLESASQLRNTSGCAVLTDADLFDATRDGDATNEDAPPDDEDAAEDPDAGPEEPVDADADMDATTPEGGEDAGADAVGPGGGDAGDGGGLEAEAGHTDVCVESDGGCCDLGEHDLLCSNCQQECRAGNVDVSCGVSACLAQCSPGFKSCDPLVRGCETDVRTPRNCGDCGKVCVYDYCGATGCESKVNGMTSLETTRLLAEGEVNGFSLFLAHPFVRALGALVDPERRGDRIRIALFAANANNMPEELAFQSDALVAEDSVSSEVAKGSGMLRVEWRVERTLDLNKRYWIFVQASQSTRFAARAQMRPHVAYVAPFVEFDRSLPEYPTVPLTVPSIYAVTTPE